MVLDERSQHSNEVNREAYTAHQMHYDLRRLCLKGIVRGLMVSAMYFDHIRLT
jgi:hypothetical protein